MNAKDYEPVDVEAVEKQLFAWYEDDPEYAGAQWPGFDTGDEDMSRYIVREHVRGMVAEIRDLRAQVVYLKAQMGTPEDRDLHDRAIAEFRAALTAVDGQP